MLEAFIVGSIGWWIVTFCFFVFCVICVDRIAWFWSISCIVLYVLFLQYLGKYDAFTFVVKSPVFFIICIIAYFLIGTVWSLVKWWLFLKKKSVRALKELNQKQEERKKLNQEYKKHTTKNFEVTKAELYMPTLQENKGRISMWIAYWPISIIWSILDDFIKDLCRAIVDKIKILYASILKAALEDIKKEVNKENK